MAINHAELETLALWINPLVQDEDSLSPDFSYCGRHLE
jgi:hypothetical protein